jgi:hypothetical protein
MAKSEFLIICALLSTLFNCSSYLFLPLLTSCDNSAHIGVVWHYNCHVVHQKTSMHFDAHTFFSLWTKAQRCWSPANCGSWLVCLRCQCQPFVFMCEIARNHHVLTQLLVSICVLQVPSRCALMGHTYVSPGSLIISDSRWTYQFWLANMIRADPTYRGSSVRTSHPNNHTVTHRVHLLAIGPWI